MGPKLTCLVRCQNDQSDIVACVESCLPLADEILIADSCSTERTLDLGRHIGDCRVIARDVHRSDDFKHWAISQASHEWVLLLCADERVTSELSEEVLSALQTGPKFDSYWIRRNNHFMGRRVHSCGWNNDALIRLFRRNAERSAGRAEQAPVELQTSRVGQLDQALNHYACWSYEGCLGKLDREAKVQAKIWHDEGVRPSYARMLFRPTARFLHNYLLRCGFLDGEVGLQISILAALSCFMKQARLWELHHAKQQSELEPEIPPFTRPTIEQAEKRRSDNRAVGSPISISRAA